MAVDVWRYAVTAWPSSQNVAWMCSCRAIREITVLRLLLDDFAAVDSYMKVATDIEHRSRGIGAVN